MISLSGDDSVGFVFSIPSPGAVISGVVWSGGGAELKVDNTVGALFDPAVKVAVEGVVEEGVKGVSKRVRQWEV